MIASGLPTWPPVAVILDAPSSLNVMATPNVVAVPPAINPARDVAVGEDHVSCR
jgi:hypothetical protein